MYGHLIFKFINSTYETKICKSAVTKSKSVEIEIYTKCVCCTVSLLSRVSYIGVAIDSFIWNLSLRASPSCHKQGKSILCKVYFSLRHCSSIFLINASRYCVNNMLCVHVDFDRPVHRELSRNSMIVILPTSWPELKM